MEQTRQTGKQMMHGGMLNKATKSEFSLFNIFVPNASFALQFGDFVPRDRSAANGPSSKHHE